MQVKQRNATAIITSNGNYDNNNNDNYYNVPGTGLNYIFIQFLHQIYKMDPVIAPISYWGHLEPEKAKDKASKKQSCERNQTVRPLTQHLS